MTGIANYTTPTCTLPEDFSPPSSCTSMFTIASISTVEGTSVTTTYAYLYRFATVGSTEVLFGPSGTYTLDFPTQRPEEIPCIPGGTNMALCAWTLQTPPAVTTCPPSWTGRSTGIVDGRTTIVCCPSHSYLTDLSATMDSQYRGANSEYFTSIRFYCQGSDAGTTSAGNDITVTYQDNITRTLAAASVNYKAVGFQLVYNNTVPPTDLPGGMKAETKVGLGVGLGIGIPALIVIGALLWLLRKRGTQPSQPVQNGGPRYEAVMGERAELHHESRPLELDGRTHPRSGE